MKAPKTINIEVSAFSKEIAQIIARAAFGLWNDEHFRDLISFTTIGQSEQDRIFNELEVTVLGLLVLHLDHLKLNTNFKTQQPLIKALRVKLVEDFLQIYRDLKVGDELVDQWKTLIDMRLEEYQKDFQLLLKEAKYLETYEDDKEFQIVWARVETLTLDSVTHVRRGNLEAEDPLIKFFQKWIVTLDTDFSKFCQKLLFKPLGES